MIYVIITFLLYPVFYVASRLRPAGGGSRRILVIQTAKIGDLVCSTPVLRELKRRYPGSFVALMADPAPARVLDGSPWVDGLIPVRSTELKGLAGKLRVAGMLRRMRFDAVVCLSPNVANTVAAVWALIPERYSVGPDTTGVTFRAASLLNRLTEWHERGTSVVATYMRLLRGAFQVRSDPGASALELPVSVEARAKAGEYLAGCGLKRADFLVGVAPAAGNKLKEIPPEVFARAADMIVERYNARVILIGGGADRKVTGDVGGMMKARALDSAGEFAIGELPALLERLGLFVSGDTGPSNMAMALGVPSVILAGPCDMGDRPLTALTEVVQKDLPCVPCTRTFSTVDTCRTGTRECVEGVAPEAVVEAAERVLGRAGRHHAATR